MTVISFPDPYSQQQPLGYPNRTRGPGIALDHFFTRRRSAAIGEQFWTVVAREWPGFNPVERTRWVRLFSRYKAFWTPDILSPEDRAFYDFLPDDFMAYRGQNGVELAAGGSFTLSPDVARGYALGRRNISYSDPTVLSLRVVKRDVALVFTSREERDIVLFPSLSSNLRSEALHCARATH